jgi:hypothetical protein
VKLPAAIRSFLTEALAALKRLFRTSAPAAPTTKGPPQEGAAATSPAPTHPTPHQQEDDQPDRPPTDFSALPQPSLAIDLGAAYTKISYRPRIQPGQPFNAESTQLILDDTALIPSIVLCDPAGTWHFGSTAAGLKPAVGWHP